MHNMTKRDVYELSLEIDNIENALNILDPTHWYESRQINVLNNRLAEISNLLGKSPRAKRSHLNLLSSPCSPDSPSNSLNALT